MYSNIEESLNDLKDTHFSSYDSKKIEEEILNLFEGKVGEKPDESKLQEYEVIGEERYKEKTPPGYLDQSKNKFHNKYGDVINWLDIIEYATKEESNIIFVTSEKKEDWFEKSNGEILRPRIELINEFNNKTKKLIAIYRIESFMNFAKVRLGINSIDENVLDEINKIDRYKRDLYLSSINNYILSEINENKYTEYKNSYQNEINDDEIYKYNNSILSGIDENKYTEYKNSYQNEINDDEIYRYDNLILNKIDESEFEKNSNFTIKPVYRRKHTINSRLRRLNRRLDTIRHQIILNRQENNEEANLELERVYNYTIKSIEKYNKELFNLDDIINSSKNEC